MRELVDKADKAIIDESDAYIKCCLTDLEDILDWSGRRHWTIMWPVIIGVILTVIFLSWRVDKKQEDVEDRQIPCLSGKVHRTREMPGLNLQSMGIRVR